MNLVYYLFIYFCSVQKTFLILFSNRQCHPHRHLPWRDSFHHGSKIPLVLDLKIPRFTSLDRQHQNRIGPLSISRWVHIECQMIRRIKKKNNDMFGIQWFLKDSRNYFVMREGGGYWKTKLTKSNYMKKREGGGELWETYYSLRNKNLKSS